MSNTTFTDLGVPANIVSALAADGKTDAFPIQVDTLPDSLQGRDILGRGKTGSGKTLAFAIPMVTHLQAGASRRVPGKPRGLILAPTRELATQIAATLEPLAIVTGLRVTTIFGGVPQGRQVGALKRGVDIVVACPGRLEDLMKQRHISLDAVEITVLDEADHMADLGFLPGVTRIMTATPSDGQRLLFSATLDNGINTLVKRFLKNAVMHSVDEANSPVAAMTHHIFEVDSADEKKRLINALAAGTGRRILFMRTKHHAKRLAKHLTEQGIPAVDLHGNLSQAQRDRNLNAFGEGGIRVLVATDVAARGVHVDNVELVVHVDPPVEHKAYLHRSGRTARAGQSGDVVTVVLPDQRQDLRRLLRKADINAQAQRVTASSAPVANLVGELAPHVTPAPPSPEVRRGDRAPHVRHSPRGRSVGSRSGASRSGSSWQGGDRQSSGRQGGRSHTNRAVRATTR
ncbi:DEAD/DEAH box helicase [Hoyosella rhizosphaerae]|uniref:ATP-dependent RNA helicase n=1 Tax=Hoyosella rhizosphaerae TaxID=1755582 RepID=A0A916U887_9ACTN|nr:DEAD/DEAH box helicase [Hoyosella rhizosphaerae]MBN4927468.1 DEAD/DEAH box helicase [Hoyosella rhizosphaerae]GGC64196.1 putative ATP-dependent RNA helicase [Hoyosella rhizosphaerae]